MTTPFFGTTAAGGVLDIDPEAAGQAISACQRLKDRLVDIRANRIHRLPSASLRLGTFVSSQQLIAAYGALWDTGADSLDQIVSQHVAAADSMILAFRAATGLLLGVDADNATSITRLVEPSPEGGVAALFDHHVRDLKSSVETASAWNLSPRTVGYQGLPVTVSEPFAVMPLEQIVVGAQSVISDLDILLHFMRSWQVVGQELITAAEDAAAGLRVLRAAWQGMLAEQIDHAVGNYLVSLSTLGSAAVEVSQKLDVTSQGLGHAVGAVPVVVPTTAEARVVAEVQARDAMELLYRPVVVDAVAGVPVLPPPDVPTTGSETGGSANTNGSNTGGTDPRAGSQGGSSASSTGSGEPVGVSPISSRAGDAHTVTNAEPLMNGHDPRTLPSEATTSPASVTPTSPHVSGTEPTRPIPTVTGTGAPGTGSPAGGVFGPGGGIAGPRPGSAGPVATGWGGGSRISPGNPLAPGNTSSPRTPGTPGPQTPGQTSATKASVAGGGRSMMGGVAPMGAMGAGAGSQSQDHKAASYLTNRRNGHAIVGTLPRTAKLILGADKEHFDR
ncbi:hypothetical protein IEU95_03345 [Hoyosella rhizosphaerae]|uniref:Uncharacterized protein n=1 Tax=Hoyosella rhizosphaerae TaxID=1755582 RepID=A0A916UCG6_9ACTN|nr:hypothetical protein [Hoyosella rhizosphaerae]MBN4925849.1 hypothetical protein [Hoyosella rhizosphaerae]GGC67471.1 hypothetical protein GCM10011410_20200 [Hoyosella rhizosphaerae]